jgi:hypothetical protein
MTLTDTPGHLRADPDLLYEGPGWLRVEEELAPVAPRTFGVTGDGTAARLTAYHFDESCDAWTFARPDLLLADLGVDPREGGALPGWLLGGRRPGHSWIATSEGSEFSGTARVAVVREATDTLRRAGARTLLAPYVSDTRDGAAFAASGYRAVPSYSRWELDVPRGGFEDYVARLSSNGRKNVRRERRALERAGVVTSVVPLGEADLDEIVDLEVLGYERYASDFSRREAMGLHAAVQRHLPGSAWVALCRDGAGVLLAFAAMVVAGERGYLRQGGVDHERAGDLPVYFETTFYAPVEFAQRSGVTTLDLSITADEGKRSRGCREVRTTAYYLGTGE